MKTRASKLVVFMSGVTALFGCAALRQSDKPNPSSPSTYRRPVPPSAPIDKNTASYISARDSLKEVLHQEALAILQTPVSFKPMILPKTSFEQYALQAMTIKKINPYDSAYTLRLQVDKKSADSEKDGLLQIMDCDEILHEAGSAQYLEYKDDDSSNYLIATQELRALRACADSMQPNEPHGKLYLLFSSVGNAGSMSTLLKDFWNMRGDLSQLSVSTGYLKKRDLGMMQSSLAHEKSHEKTWDALNDYLIQYGDMHLTKDLKADADQLYNVKYYNEFQCDSLGFVRENAEGRLLNVKPQDLNCIKRWTVDYQWHKNRAAAYVDKYGTSEDTASTKMKNRYLADKSSMLQDTRFYSVEEKMTHPNAIMRIYYLDIHQRRAKELHDNGKTILYEQYGDLLLRPPILSAQPSAPPAPKIDDL